MYELLLGCASAHGEDGFRPLGFKLCTAALPAYETQSRSSLTLNNVGLPDGIAASAYGRIEDFLALQNASAVQFIALTMQVDGTPTDSGATTARMSLSFGFDYEAQLGGRNICSINVTTGTQNYSAICFTGLISVATFEAHPCWFSLSTQEFTNGSPVPLSG